MEQSLSLGLNFSSAIQTNLTLSSFKWKDPTPNLNYQSLRKITLRNQLERPNSAWHPTVFPSALPGERLQGEKDSNNAIWGASTTGPEVMGTNPQQSLFPCFHLGEEEGTRGLHNDMESFSPKPIKREEIIQAKNCSHCGLVSAGGRENHSTLGDTITLPQIRGFFQMPNMQIASC